jgi:excisionase family DNA binding protein
LSFDNFSNTVKSEESMKGWMSISEAAAYTGRTRQSILRAIKADMLPADRLGNQWAIKTSEMKRCYVPCGAGKMMLSQSILPGKQMAMLAQYDKEHPGWRDSNPIFARGKG